MEIKILATNKGVKLEASGNPEEVLAAIARVPGIQSSIPENPEVTIVREQETARVVIETCEIREATVESISRIDGQVRVAIAILFTLLSIVLIGSTVVKR